MLGFAIGVLVGLVFYPVLKTLIKNLNDSARD